MEARKLDKSMELDYPGEVPASQAEPEAGYVSRRIQARIWRFPVTVPNFIWTVITAVVLIALLQVMVRQKWVSPYVVAAPSDIWHALVSGFQQGIYWSSIGSTVGSAVFGFLIAFGASIIVAGVFASIPKLDAILFPFVVAFQALPKVAIAPLVLLIIGFGYSAKVVIVVAVCFFPLLVNCIQGFKIRDQDFYELLKSLGASRLQMFWRLRAPAALPFIFAGMHISMLFALLGAIVAEFIGAQTGLGVLLIYDKNAFNIPAFYAVLLIMMIIGIIIDVVMNVLERWLVFWARDMSTGRR
jgi:NitT/TauT family transport system permease protein